MALRTRGGKAKWLGRVLLLAVLAVSFAAAGQALRRWAPLNKDGVHDPKSPAVRVLQEPREALSRLPADNVGNQVRWVEALREGLIKPRTNIYPETRVRVLETDVLMNLDGGTPIVRFPHLQHTMWLDCSNCHEQLFKSRAGANKVQMARILEGEQCGLCHGAVAFPLTECKRCHSVARTAARPTDKK